MVVRLLWRLCTVCLRRLASELSITWLIGKLDSAGVFYRLAYVCFRLEGRCVLPSFGLAGTLRWLKYAYFPMIVSHRLSAKYSLRPLHTKALWSKQCRHIFSGRILRVLLHLLSLPTPAANSMRLPAIFDNAAKDVRFCGNISAFQRLFYGICVKRKQMITTDNRSTLFRSINLALSSDVCLQCGILVGPV